MTSSIDLMPPRLRNRVATQPCDVATARVTSVRANGAGLAGIERGSMASPDHVAPAAAGGGDSVIAGGGGGGASREPHASRQESKTLRTPYPISASTATASRTRR